MPLFNAHKKTIAPLRHTVAQQASLLDAIERSMAVIELDLQGNVLRANDNFLNTMSYRAEQIVGQPHRMFCTQAFARSAEYNQLWSNLRNGQFQSGTFERVAGAGQSVWLEANYNPVYDASGRLCKVVKFASDVTAMVQQHSADAASAAQAYHISLTTRDIAEKGAEEIQQTASVMREIAADIEGSSQLIAKLGERSQQITAIVNSIRAIADQTNLLALNAAIEAARAGEQGRGFAGVADEVRQLAARTSGSTAEISSMIAMIQDETRQAIDSMEGTSDAVQAVSAFANERGGS